VPGAGELVKVLDFGISRLPESEGPRVTSESEVIGTPEYMSPEQALGLGDRVNGRTDQHALALVMYEMLSGSRRSRPRIWRRLSRRCPSRCPRSSTAWRPECLRVSARVLHRALSKDPEERFPGIDAFIKAAQSAVYEEGPLSGIPIPNDALRGSMPVARTFGANDPVRTIALLLSRARTALLADEVTVATELATTVLDMAALTDDEAIVAVVELARPLLEGVFHSRLEPVDRKSSSARESRRSATTSPKRRPSYSPASSNRQPSRKSSTPWRYPASTRCERSSSWKRSAAWSSPWAFPGPVPAPRSRR